MWHWYYSQDSIGHESFCVFVGCVLISLLVLDRAVLLTSLHIGGLAQPRYFCGHKSSSQSTNALPSSRRRMLMMNIGPCARTSCVYVLFWLTYLIIYRDDTLIWLSHALWQPTRCMMFLNLIIIIIIIIVEFL